MLVLVFLPSLPFGGLPPPDLMPPKSRLEGLSDTALPSATGRRRTVSCGSARSPVSCHCSHCRLWLVPPSPALGSPSRTTPKPTVCTTRSVGSRKLPTPQPWALCPQDEWAPKHPWLGIVPGPSHWSQMGSGRFQIPHHSSW